jgi:hypothetical protein
MYRSVFLAAISGLLIVSSAAPTLAKPAKPPKPGSATIRSFGVANADPCGVTSAGACLGEVKVNRRGNSGGGGQYHLQVKLTGGAGVQASNSYDVLLAVATTALDPITSQPVTTCAFTDVGDLKTNSQGKGVSNFKYNVAVATDAYVVLRDKTFDPLVPASQGADLGSSKMTLAFP